MSMHENQLSVPLAPPLRDYVRRAAERENRTMANWVRSLIIKAAWLEAQQQDGAQRNGN
jgi:hypothetical protein